VTISVVKKSTIDEDIHLNNPNVIKFSGNRSMFIIGFPIKDIKVRITPAIIRVITPLSKEIPSITFEMKYKESVSIKKCLNTFFIILIYHTS
jgi:hypothetical protein